MSAHTPGPWQASGVRVHMNGDQWLTVTTSDGNVIAYIPCDLTPSLHLEAHADRRLISTAPDLLEALQALCRPAKADEAEDMVSLRRDLTGVDNTIFVSTKGYAQHAPRIKIAVDPPDTFNATSKSLSMAINDYSVRGEYLAPRIMEQAKQFIERNRDVLLRYWNCEIDTAELIKRLKSPSAGIISIGGDEL